MMFFARLGRITAVIALTLGLWHVVNGMMIATEFFGHYEASVARSALALIDKGINVILLGVAVGLLAEIRHAVRAAK